MRLSGRLSGIIWFRHNLFHNEGQHAPPRLSGTLSSLMSPAPLAAYKDEKACHTTATQASSSATRSLPDDVRMLNRRDVFGSVREKGAVDEAEGLEKGHRIDVAGEEEVPKGVDGPLSTRDQRAIALLVMLCKCQISPAEGPRAGADHCVRVQTSCKASQSGWRSGPSHSSCAPSCPTPRSASSPSAPTHTLSSCCGHPSSIRSSPRPSGAARAGLSLSRPSLRSCCGGSRVILRP